MKKAKALLVIVFVVPLYISTEANSSEADWMPDPVLRAVVREEIDLPDAALLTKDHMLMILRGLGCSDKGIRDLTGLEYATNMRYLSICGSNLSGADLIPIADLTQLEILELCVNEISDVSSLANLTNLKVLDLGANRVSDITPLANLTNLERLNLGGNNVSDITPLANLTNLKRLTLRSNPLENIEVLANLTNLEDVHLDNTFVFDFTPLSDLNLVELTRDEVPTKIVTCKMPPLGLSPTARVENRTYPSIAVLNLVTEGKEGLEWVTREDYGEYAYNLIAKHDITFFSSLGSYGVYWVDTPTSGLSTLIQGSAQLTATGEPVYVRYEETTQRNPNFINLTNGNFNISDNINFFPPDSDFWLRDDEGNILETGAPWGEYHIDFLNPEVQQLIIDRHVAIANCGLFQGIFFDNFAHNNTGGVGIENYQATDEEIIAATTTILKGIRERVRDDFLILVNAGKSKPTRFTKYINGSYMENRPDYEGGYTYKGLKKIDSILLWNEQNLREPRINVLEGYGVYEDFESPDNLRWMRLFTTMSLTHSDGYSIFRVPNLIDRYIQGTQIWHDFWDAELGRPVGAKAQLYDNREGLFIREFTNGWAVYNRSGVAQTINFPVQATGVASGQSNKAHVVPDLDGEIYLKSTVDLNGDGVVNILDLVIVSNALGETEPDLNSDGVVNILDLVIIANNISQTSK